MTTKKLKVAARPQKTFDPETEAERLREEIEDQFPPETCSLSQYRKVLVELDSMLRERISQLDDEIR